MPILRPVLIFVIFFSLSDLQLLACHQAIEAEQRKLIAALAAGEKQQVIDSMRAIRKNLNNELALAKAIARTTYLTNNNITNPVDC